MSVEKLTTSQSAVARYYDAAVCNADGVADRLIRQGGYTDNIQDFFTAMICGDIAVDNLPYQAANTPIGVKHSISILTEEARSLYDRYSSAVGKLFTFDEPGFIPEGRIFWLPPNDLQEPPLKFSILHAMVADPTDGYKKHSGYRGHATITVQEVTPHIKSGNVTTEPIEVRALHNITRVAGKPLDSNYLESDARQIKPDCIGFENILRRLGAAGNIEEALAVGGIGLAQYRLNKNG